MRYLISIIAVLMITGLSACGGEDETDTSDNAMSTEPVAQSAPIADKDPLTGESRSERMKRTETEEVESLPESDMPSPGLQMTLGGSDAEEFEESMKILQKNLTAAEYNRLKTAIQYLALYDFENRGKDALYASLDGLTPVQVEARAKEKMNR